jgi:hypothetical protein
MRALTASPEQVAAATPADRDRYPDLLRGLAIGVVVLGHWLLAVVWMAGGRLRATAVLDAAPGTRWVTWLFQVMPLFFLVGGVVNARSWRATRAVGGGYVGWIARRAARLLRPTVVLVWTWVALAAVAAAVGVGPRLIVLGARSALIPLWFLAVYLLMTAGVPVLLQAYDRLGPALVVALLATATAVDVAVRVGVPVVGYANYLLVWAVPTVLGFAWHDGRLDRRAVRVGMPVAALAGLLVAVLWLGWPVSMIRVGEAGGPNVPAVTLALLGCAQAGVAAVVRRPATAWLDRPGPWTAVVRINTVAMTVYLWHLTVLVLVVGALSLTGSWWSVAPLSLAWWLTRPLWLAGLAVLLAPVVVTLLPVEHSVPAPRRHGTGPLAVAGMLVATATAAGATAAVTLGGVLGLPGVACAVALTAAARHAGAFGGTGTVAR